MVDADGFQVFGESFDQFGWGLVLMVGELLFVEEPDASKEFVQILPLLEPLLVPLVIKSIELQDLANLITHNKLQLEMLLIPKRHQPLGRELDLLTREEHPEIRSNPTVRLIERRQLELLLTFNKTEIHLLVQVDRVDGGVVVQLELLHFQQGDDVLGHVFGSEDDQEVDVAVDGLLGQGDVGLEAQAERGERGGEVVGDRVVLLRGQFGCARE